MIHIHGENGIHATDLKRRGIINDLDHDDSNEDKHLLVINIEQTGMKIRELLESGVSQENILNFCGVMTKWPNAITNLHFLFWPDASNDLKVAIAWPKSKLCEKILERVNISNIRIIGTSRTEHDRKMAIIQWLSHLFLLLIWENNERSIQSNLIHPWKTPINTVSDMIFENPFAENIAIEFFDWLMKSNWKFPFEIFQHIVTKHLSQQDIDDFSTPNFNRIFWFKQEIDFSLNITLIEEYRKSLNTFWKIFLKNKIESIRNNTRASLEPQSP